MALAKERGTDIPRDIMGLPRHVVLPEQSPQESSDTQEAPTARCSVTHITTPTNNAGPSRPASPLEAKRQIQEEDHPPTEPLVQRTDLASKSNDVPGNEVPTTRQSPTTEVMETDTTDQATTTTSLRSITNRQPDAIYANQNSVGEQY